MSVPPAIGDPRPVWPLQGRTPVVYTHGGKAFGASRASGARAHAGVDLPAPRGSIVVATESGTLIASQSFLGPTAVALLQQTDSGPVILYGEVEPDSWRELGLRIGDHVAKGQPIARVGLTPGGSSMLHFEAYVSGTRRNYPWYQGSPPPPALRDPTDYLTRAAAVSSGELPELEEHDDDDHDHDVEEPPQSVEPEDDEPDASSELPSRPDVVIPEVLPPIPRPRPSTPSTRPPATPGPSMPPELVAAGLGGFALILGLSMVVSGRRVRA